MKLITTVDIKGHFENGDEWRAKRAIVKDSFKDKKGHVNEYVKILKVCEGVVLPDGEFTALYDDRGRVAGFNPTSK